MEDLGVRRMQLFIYIAVLIAVIIAGSCLYTVYLITKSGLAEDDQPTGEVVDYYNIELQKYLGINGEGYENRELYTNAMFEEDRKKIISYLNSNQYEMIQSLANSNLYKYRYDDNKLSTMTALSSVVIMVDSEDSEKIQDRILMVSSISDPELFIRFFLKLPYNEQALIAGESIYALPGFNYKDITVDMFYIANQNTKTYGALGGQEHCRVTLRHFGREFYVHLNTNSGIQIMYVNDQDESLNQTYTLVQED